MFEPAEDFDYITETEVTASGVFTPDNVGHIELSTLLALIIVSCQSMDKFKKAMFRKRTREESGLGLMVGLPLSVDQSMADLFHGIIGNITEVGEQAEILLKFLDDGEEPDIANVREEIGDNLWYLARLVKFSETTFFDEMVRNIRKLRARHGDQGFSKEGDMNRDLKNERTILED